MLDLDHGDLLDFIINASLSCYASGARFELAPERSSFKEMVYKHGDFTYRDSYTGYLHSWGSEVVRFKDTPVWASSYGGGIEQGREQLARKCFKFLKTSLSEPDHDSNNPTFRGPNFMRLGDWRYYYEQDGDVVRFAGNEKITYQKQLVFTHTIIGGLIIDRHKL